MKKWRFLAMSAALCLILTACQGGAGSPDTSDTAGMPPSQDPSSAQAGSEPAARDYSEHMVISHALVGQVEGVDYNGDALAKAFEDQFNFEWDSVNLTWDNWKEKANIWINSNDLPDMMQWDFNYGDYMNYTSQGLLRRLPDDWKTRWPNVARLTEVSVINEALDKKSGGTYFIPKPVYFSAPTDPIITHNSLYLRKDWMKQVGFTEKDAYTLEELMDFARKVKDADPAGNGRTIPIDGVIEDLAYVFMQQSNVYFTSFYKGNDGQYRWGPADAGTLEGLKLWQQAYREGLLNKDFYSGGIMPADNYYNGLSASMYGSCTAHNINLVFDQYIAYSGRNPLDDIQISFVVDGAGKHHTPEIKNFWTGTVISPKISEEKFERIMDILDYSASEEGQNLTRLGIEGEDYKVEANGQVTLLREQNEDGTYKLLSDKYPSLLSLFNNLTVLPDDFAMRDPSVAPERLALVTNMFAKKAQIGIDQGTVPLLDWELTFFTSPAYEKFQLNYPEEYAKLILMDGDLTANWQSWVEEKSSMANAVIEELNAMEG